PEFRLHRQRPLARIVPPRHCGSGSRGRGVHLIVTGTGGLYGVARPIGHPRAISARARETLAAASAVAAEDTRHSGRLLRELGLEGPLVSLHRQNGGARPPELVERLRAGERIALVSDAGTPLVSDPGYLLVAAAIEAGITVTPVPGPS